MLRSTNVIFNRCPQHMKQAFLVLSVIFSTVTGLPQKGSIPRQTRIDDMLGFPMPIDRETPLIDDMHQWPNPKFRMNNPPPMMRPPFSTMYMDSMTRTILRKVDRADTTPKNINTTSGTSDFVVFLDKKSTTEPNGKKQSTSSTSTSTTNDSIEAILNTRISASDNFVPDTSDVEKCRQNLLSSCNVSSSYPRSHVQGLISGNKLIRELFGSDVLYDELTTRFEGFGDQGRSLCSSSEYIHFPTIGETKNGEFRYILQHRDNDHDYTQGIRLEVCQNNGKNKNCDLGSLRSSMPLGYSAQCIQKYSYRKLVSLSSNGQPVQDQFKIPSCCMCMYMAT